MKFSKGIVFMLVLATVALLSQGAKTAQDSKRDKKGKGKNRQQTDVAEIAIVDPPESPVVISQEVRSPDDVEIAVDVVPSAVHNGKLNKKQKKEQKQAKKAEKKALKKAEKKKRRKEERRANKHGDKASKKAQRKAAKYHQRQEDVDTEIVSFDDIVEERHGDTIPNPNPLPPVEGAATESQKPGNVVNEQATENKAERRHQRKLAKKEQKKNAKKAQRHHKEHITCESDNDCGRGSCCVEKKGSHFCMKSKKDEGQKCADDCMCRAGLVCLSEEVSPGKERGICRVEGTPELTIGNKIGTVEDAVEDVIGANQ